MLCDQHERMVRRAAGFLNIHGLPLEALLRGSTFPDGADDLTVDGRKEVLGARICSSTHFCVETTPGHYRGWNWKLDPSIKWLNVPDRDVVCDPSPWSRVAIELGCPETVALPWALRHPQIRLSIVPGYNLAFDETTLAGANVMTEWKEELMLRTGTGRDVFPQVAWWLAGCIAHDLLDQFVPYHANGWILWRQRSVCKMRFLRGPTHTQYEARCLEQWKRDEETYVDDGEEDADRDMRRWTARHFVEHASDLGRPLTSPKDTNRLAWRYLLVLLDRIGSQIVP